MNTQFMNIFQKKNENENENKINIHEYKHSTTTNRKSFGALDNAKGGTHLGAFVFDKILLSVPEGLSAMGFSIPEIITKWSGRLREAAMDSTCAWFRNFSFLPLLYIQFAELSCRGHKPSWV